MNNFDIDVNYIENEEDTSTQPYSAPVYPGYRLTIGSSGSSVSIMQSYLNAIRNGMFPTLGRLTVDGIYGNATRNTVMNYQSLSGLKADGIIGRLTWDSIIEDYNTLPGTPGDEYPGKPLRSGNAGVEVGNMQAKLNRISPVYTRINYQIVDGIYGTNMSNAVRRFQSLFGLKADGIIGRDTWNKITSVYNGVINDINTPVTASYPGYILNIGSTGDSVRFIQAFLNYINEYYNYNWRPLTVDGVYGQLTKQLVKVFQTVHNLKADGITGGQTWQKIISEINKII